VNIGLCLLLPEAAEEEQEAADEEGDEPKQPEQAEETLLGVLRVTVH